MHGEPMQGMVISCNHKECAFKPRIEVGDVFDDGGKERAISEAAAVWNRRADAAPQSDIEKIVKKWSFGLAEACNEALKAKAVADHETFEDAIRAIIKEAGCAPQPDAPERRELEIVRTAIEISAGYVALVASGADKVPIRKERAQSDCDIISHALAILDRIGGA